MKKSKLNASFWICVLAAIKNDFTVQKNTKLLD